jgi:hypothetical protein
MSHPENHASAPTDATTQPPQHPNVKVIGVALPRDAFLVEASA